MKKTILYSAIISTVVWSVTGQQLFTTKDTLGLVTLDYKLYPNLNSVSVETLGVLIKETLEVNQGQLSLDLSYANTSIGIDTYKWSPVFDTYNQIHHLQLGASYTYPLSDRWNVDATLAPVIASTLNAPLRSKDVVLVSALGFSTTLGTDALPSYLSFGVGYGTLLGAPRWYPMFTYFKTVNSQFNYKIGFPETVAYYHINSENTIDFSLKPESLYAYNSEATQTQLNTLNMTDSYLEFTALKLGLGYKFHFDANWSTYFNVGYSISPSFSIQHDNPELYDFEPESALSLGLGIRFNI